MKKLKEIWSSFDKNILIILFVAVIVLSPILAGKYMTGHDTYYHFANISILTENIDILGGKWFPDKVVPIAMNNFGLGEGIFYPSLPHYVTAYLYKGLSHLGLSLLTVMNIVHLLVLFLAGLSMYFLVKKISKNSFAALLSSIVYITFPYFFSDICIRDAYSETFLFLFLPLIFLGLQYLLEKNYRNFYIWFIIGFVGAINSHLVLSIYIAIFTIIFLLLNFKNIWNKKSILSLCISALIIFGFSAPFLIPLIEHMLFGDYAVYQDGYMWAIGMILNTRVGLYDYFLPPSNFLNNICVITSLVGFICFLLVIFNKYKIKYFNVVKKYILLAIMVFILMLPIFPWDMFPNFLLSIQFVLRLQVLLVFFMSVVSGFAITLVKEKLQKNITIIMAVVSIFSVCSLYSYAYVEYLTADDIDVNKYARANYEYLPYSAVVDKDYLENRSDNIVVLDGNAKVKNVVSHTPNLTFDIKTDGATIEIPRLYYLGYEISLKTTTEAISLKYKEAKTGFISIDVPESGIINIKYVGTNGYKLALILLIGSVLCSMIYLIKTRKISREM